MGRRGHHRHLRRDVDVPVLGWEQGGDVETEGLGEQGVGRASARCGQADEQGNRWEGEGGVRGGWKGMRGRG